MASRRDVLKGTLATAAAAVAPALPALAEPLAPIAIPTLDNVAWVVGDDRFGLVWAQTMEDAIDTFRCEQGIHLCDEGEEIGSHCGSPNCDGCDEYRAVEARRVPKLDDLPLEQQMRPRNAHYQMAGLWVRCDRCEDAGDYYNDDEGYDDQRYIVDGDTICTDCLNYEPLSVVAKADPERAAEMLDDILTGEYGPEVV